MRVQTWRQSKGPKCIFRSRSSSLKYSLAVMVSFHRPPVSQDTAHSVVDDTDTSDGSTSR